MAERKSYLVVGDMETYVLTGTMSKKKMRDEYVSTKGAKMTLVEGAFLWDEIRARNIPEIDLDDDGDYK